ncbi:hypothetical protein ACLIIZ_11255 [Azonexus caeni]|jgi:hypothetical protein|uniref:hypothetical protein n=1 Tax=Azonexus caeni TaxID=266126 RepID=UPI003A887479
MTVLVSLEACEAIAPPCIAKIITGDALPKGGGIWSIGNEIRPSDFYCYLYAKFGPPNGLQNFLREDDSANLIHWDWTFAHTNGLMMILGLNMRTEVHLIGRDWDFPNCDKQQFIDYVKRDLGKYGKQMSHIRSTVLEDWDMFVNPYRQLRDAITQLKKDLDELALNPETEQLSNFQPGSDQAKFQAEWTALTTKYNRGIGLAMAIRAMTPVLAESFINLIFFILCRPDIKKNERLYNSAVRANIDIKVQSLHINCIGFKSPIDWSSSECARYNTVVNERNDMLHGNVVVDKLKFSEIYFLGKVPIFKSYQSFWQHSIGVSINASGFDKVSGDIEAVNEFITYVMSCLDDKLKEQVEMFTDRRDIGVNKKTKRLGLLLPEHIVDFGVSLVSKG